MSTTAPWYALQTRPKCEKKVEYLLTQKGYKCLLPTYSAKRQWSDRVVRLNLPLFPSYIFCCSNASAVGKVITVPGVTRIVGFNGRAAEVAEKEIEALLLLSQSDLLHEPWQYIPNGTLVKVETGPLAGVEGIFSLVDSKKRLVISVSLLQQSVAVKLDKGTVVSVVEGQDKNKGLYPDETLIALKLLSKARKVEQGGA